ncbi:hypothetical protein [Microbulbifer sp. TRSA005]|uniref:hypothetical protein n=1 Tax=unclassified Microbulbifer TaxID=2619833 RepID=UPI00403901A5
MQARHLVRQHDSSHKEVADNVSVYFEIIENGIERILLMVLKKFQQKLLAKSLERAPYSLKNRRGSSSNRLSIDTQIK